MRYAKALLLSFPLAALAFTPARDASACGGCFVQETESSQVTGHKMVLSVSKTQTTLWDQISYSGRPASFGWVLPTKGIVSIELSSDALFQNLDQATQVTIASPVIQCNPPPDCNNKSGSGGASFGGSDSEGSSTGTGGPPPVTVIAEEVVGPYETVQLESTDPGALKAWLVSHDYNVPADIAPVIDAYVAEGFNFLALKLVPGAEVSAMRPVRITTPGASPVLPLRMVAAGTGAVTPITLWILSEGRYEPANLPMFTIASSELVWDWDSSSSNYAALKKSKFADSDGKAWLVEAGEPFSKYYLQDNLTWLAQSDPKGSGYADDMGEGAEEAAAADLADLFGNIDESSLWVTRLNAQLSREALADDLELGASADQTYLNRYLEATTTVGTPPTCQVFPPCLNGSGSGSSGDGWGFWGTGGGDAVDGKTGGGCAMTEGSGVSATMSTLVLAAALSLSRARRRQR